MVSWRSPRPTTVEFVQILFLKWLINDEDDDGDDEHKKGFDPILLSNPLTMCHMIQLVLHVSQ